MPNIRVTVPSGQWSKEEKQKIAEQLSNTMVDIVNEVKGMEKDQVTPHVHCIIDEAGEGGYSSGGINFG